MNFEPEEIQVLENGYDTNYWPDQQSAYDGGYYDVGRRLRLGSMAGTKEEGEPRTVHEEEETGDGGRAQLAQLAVRR